MAYSTSSPPRLLSHGGLYGIGATNGGQLWEYVSADALATVRAANYFTNAVDLGMKVGDVVFVNDTASPAIALARVTAVASTGSTLSTGLAIT